MTFSNSLPMATKPMFDWVISFSIWVFMLSVCSLVVGFPLLAVVVLGGGMIEMAFQGVIPSSVFFITTAFLFAITVLAPLLGAGILTALNVDPYEVIGDNDMKTPLLVQSAFASCPLTCSYMHSETTKSSIL